MELLTKSNNSNVSIDLKLLKPSDEQNGNNDHQITTELKVPDEETKTSSASTDPNDTANCNKTELAQAIGSKEDHDKPDQTVKSAECSPSYSGATEPIEGNSPSYSGATEENLDGQISPTKSNSPEPNCAICLGKLENKSFTDSCFHQFCFTCLLEWSKVKAECPLCKQAFKSIIHNVRSIEDYDQYYITVRNGEAKRSWRSPEGRRFRYPSTLTTERRRQLEFEHSVEFQNYRYTYAPHLYRGLNSRYPSMNRSTTSDYRKNIYNNNFWVVPQPEAQRYRETAPDFFRQNPACTHRLIPWLNRELLALLSHSENQVSFILELILALITRYDIKSSEFYEHIFPYLQERTTHFIHEFIHFARSPHDMTGYDRSATYEQLENSNSTFTRESTSSSPDSVIEVPVDALGENHFGRSRSHGPNHQIFHRPYRSSDFRRRKSKFGITRSRDRFSPINFQPSSQVQVLDLDMPGTSRQEFTLPFRPWDRTDLSLNSSVSTSLQDSEEDCVIVDCVTPVKNQPAQVITIPSSSDEEYENANLPAPSKKSLSYEKPATRKNRCTFHYDYSSDSCSEQTDSVQPGAVSNAEQKKIRIKSIVGSVSSSLSMPSSSSEQGSHRSSKKHKKHKKHKHKHNKHRYSKSEKE